jgi:hypothetical protein
MPKKLTKQEFLEAMKAEELEDLIGIRLGEVNDLMAWMHDNDVEPGEIADILDELEPEEVTKLRMAIPRADS